MLDNSARINNIGRLQDFCKNICPCLDRECLKKNQDYAQKIKARPIYRDDAFYTHSMALLPQYDEVKSLVKAGSPSPSHLNKKVS